MTTGYSPPPDGFEDQTPNVTVRHEGTLSLFKLDALARAWVEQHVPGEKTFWCGSLVVEARYVDLLIDGMIGDGIDVDEERAARQQRDPLGPTR